MTFPYSPFDLTHVLSILQRRTLLPLPQALASTFLSKRGSASSSSSSSSSSPFFAPPLRCVSDSSLHSVASLLAVQLFSAIEYMHARGVMHRDVKPGNVLVLPYFYSDDSSSDSSDDEGPSRLRFVLADFGQARNVPPDSGSYAPSAADKKTGTLTPQVCTRWYRAPELLLSSPSYTPSVDVWSASLCVAEVLNHGEPLLKGGGDIDQLWKVAQLVGEDAGGRAKTPASSGGEQQQQQQQQRAGDYGKVSFKGLHAPAGVPLHLVCRQLRSPPPSSSSPPPSCLLATPSSASPPPPRRELAAAFLAKGLCGDPALRPSAAALLKKDPWLGGSGGAAAAEGERLLERLFGTCGRLRVEGKEEGEKEGVERRKRGQEADFCGEANGDPFGVDWESRLKAVDAIFSN